MYLFPRPAPAMQIEILDIKHKVEHIIFASKQTSKQTSMILIPGKLNPDFSDPQIDGD